MDFCAQLLSHHPRRDPTGRHQVKGLDALHDWATASRACTECKPARKANRLHSWQAQLRVQTHPLHSLCIPASPLPQQFSERWDEDELSSVPAWNANPRHQLRSKVFLDSWGTPTTSCTSVGLRQAAVCAVPGTDLLACCPAAYTALQPCQSTTRMSTCAGQPGSLVCSWYLHLHAVPSSTPGLCRTNWRRQDLQCRPRPSHCYLVARPEGT